MCYERSILLLMTGYLFRHFITTVIFERSECIMELKVLYTVLIALQFKRRKIAYVKCTIVLRQKFEK